MHLKPIRALDFFAGRTERPIFLHCGLGNFPYSAGSGRKMQSQNIFSENVYLASVDLIPSLASYEAEFMLFSATESLLAFYRCQRRLFADARPIITNDWYLRATLLCERFTEAIDNALRPVIMVNSRDL